MIDIFFDTTLQTVNLNLVPVPEEYHVVFNFMAAIVLPGPDGNQGVLPIGMVKIPIGGDMFADHAAKAAKIVEEMPKPDPKSNLAIVGNMEEAKRVGEMTDAIREGRLSA